MEIIPFRLELELTPDGASVALLYYGDDTKPSSATVLSDDVAQRMLDALPDDHE